MIEQLHKFDPFKLRIEWLVADLNLSRGEYG